MQVVKQATPVLPQAQAKFEEENQVAVPSGLYGNTLLGQAWSEGKDGRYAGVTKITVTTNKEHTVTSIQLQYIERTGAVVDGDRHGGFGRETVFELDYPKEFLIKVTGKYSLKINSLTFITNKGKYGPVGKEEGEYFETKPLHVVPIHAPIVGLSGKADEAFLYAIGVYYGLPPLP